MPGNFNTTQQLNINNGITIWNTRGNNHNNSKYSIFSMMIIQFVV